jgi:hypothetical protein
MVATDEYGLVTLILQVDQVVQDPFAIRTAIYVISQEKKLVLPGDFDFFFQQLLQCFLAAVNITYDQSS